MSKAKTVTLSTLLVGEQFHLPLCGKDGTVLSHSPGGTQVQYLGFEETTIHIEGHFGDPDTDKVIKKRHKPVVISSGSMVCRNGS